jgi:hypothetical protein
MEIPEACTLPTAERPLRLAEFDTLFTTSAVEVESTTATHARLRLTGPAGLASTVRDLTTRESECCSFFTFTVRDDGEAVQLDIEVPASYAEVLAALIARTR